MEGLCKAGEDSAPESVRLREEGVDFWGRVPDALLYIEDTDPWSSAHWKAGWVAEVCDRQGVGLWVIGG